MDGHGYATVFGLLQQLVSVALALALGGPLDQSIDGDTSELHKSRSYDRCARRSEHQNASRGGH
jgi:hypothetical protein